MLYGSCLHFSMQWKFGMGQRKRRSSGARLKVDLVNKPTLPTQQNPINNFHGLANFF